MVSLPPVAWFGTSIEVHAGQSIPAPSQTEPTLRNPVRTEYILVKNLSWDEIHHTDCWTLTVSLQNTGNERVQYYGVRVMYRDKTGTYLGGRNHLVRGPIEPGQSIELSLPEFRPSNEDGNPSVEARALRPEEFRIDHSQASPATTVEHVLSVKKPSWTELNSTGALSLIVTIENASHTRIEGFAIGVKYKDKTGKLLGGRHHFTIQPIDPGQTFNLLLPERRPPDAEGKSIVTAEPLIKIQ